MISRKRTKVMAKLTSAVPMTTVGRQIRGKLSFFIRLALSRNIDRLRPVISVNSPHTRKAGVAR